jgi:hypothetical protein
MSHQSEKIIDLGSTARTQSGTELATLQQIAGYRIGKVCIVDSSGNIYVEYEDNAQVPTLARSTIEILPEHKNKEVLIVFDRNNPKAPIITGLIQEKENHDYENPSLRRNNIINFLIDDDRVELSAKKEIVLRCGKSSVTLKKDGRIAIKGTQITSRASSLNKIRGAAVRIN